MSTLLPPALANLNLFSGTVVAQTLARLGVRDAVLCPGSRCTPLTWGFAHTEGICCLSILDERSASFFALGLAKQTQKPVVIVTTSGTAAANLFPALIEARLSGVPLWVLTADRPATSRACRAEQTIDQVRLFGAYPRWQQDIATPTHSPAYFNYLRQSLVHAARFTRGPQAGPVHLNFPFEEPLLSPLDAPALPELMGFDFDSFFAHLSEVPQISAQLTPTTLDCLRDRLHGNGLIIVGHATPENPASFTECTVALAERLQWPILTDGLNPISHFSQHPLILTHYELFLRKALPKPDCVLSIGPLPTSKILRTTLETWDVPTWLLSPSGDNTDPLHRRAISLPFSIESFHEVLTDLRPQATSVFSNTWLAAEASATSHLKAQENQAPAFFEGNIIHALAQELPPQTPVFIANSTPIRDVELFWGKGSLQRTLFVNRGANGIDGTLSTALGIAHGSKHPAVLLTGDLSLLHDTNGFLIQAQLQGSLTIILINNHGGRIFETLPVQAYRPFFDHYFLTPQSVSFEKLAASYGISYIRPPHLASFKQCLQARPPNGIHLIELEIDPQASRSHRQLLFS